MEESRWLTEGKPIRESFPMGISITIQTYNRADELRLTLAGLYRMEVAGAHEVLVVDNNSTDETPRVMEAMAGSFGSRLRYVREPRQGLSHARNRAIAEARHDIVAFLDDDVDVDPRWMHDMLAAFRTERCAAVGGRAHLIYPKSRPRWLGDRDEGYLTKVELGPLRRPAQPDELYGLNLCVQRDWLDRVGPFRTELGRMGKTLLGSEELDLLERIAAAGGKLIYEPAAAVGHRVPEQRLRRRWFWSRSYWGQRGAVRMLPEEAIRLYAFARASWHLAQASGRVACAFLRNGPASEPCFHEATYFASKYGAWIGVAGRLAARKGRLKKGSPALQRA
jgi:GT2 family glycosyltransferase